MALQRLPGLVAGTLLYSAVIGFGAISVNAWLRDADYDLSDAGQKAVTIEGAQRLVLLRSLNAFVPDPGSPMSEFVPYLRHTALRHLEPVVDYNQKLMDEYGWAAGITPLITSPAPDHSGEVLIWLIAGLLAFVIGDMLLRFRAVTAMQSTRGPRRGAGRDRPMLWCGCPGHAGLASRPRQRAGDDHGRCARQ
jgi:hypothetical protein